MTNSIFITIGEPMTARNIFRTPFWMKFRENNPGCALILLVPPDRKDYYEQQFGGPGVIVEGINPKFKSPASMLLGSLARSAILSHTNLWSKMRSFYRGDSGWLVTWCKRCYTFIFGRFDWWKYLLRALILHLAPTPAVARLYQKYKPSLLFAPSLTQYDFDVPLAVEAKRRSIRVVGMLRSWDNLSSHGLLRVVPDLFILQNEFLKNIAAKYQTIYERDVPMKIVGLPHYDVYFQTEPLLERREEFFARMGLDPNKKFILYGAMGDFLFPAEGGVANIFENLISSGRITKPTQVLFRAHPKFASPLSRMQYLKYVKPDRRATYLKEEDLNSIEMEQEDTRHLINSIYHSDIVVSAASTIVLDALALGKQVICVGFDPEPVSYWYSVKRFYDCYTHFEAFMETGAAELAGTPEELAEKINKYFASPVRNEIACRKALDLFVGPLDGKASERLEKILSAEVKT